MQNKTYDQFELINQIFLYKINSTHLSSQIYLYNLKHPVHRKKHYGLQILLNIAIKTYISKDSIS